jgi:ribosome-binding factor A
MAHNKTFARNSRLEGELRSVLSDMLRSEVNDPRLADVTVSTIRLSADRSKARVYYSVIGDSEREREAGDGFAAAAPFMRRQLGRRMHLRVVPSLEFFRDTSYEYGDRIERLFDRLSDEGLLATNAGDENGSEEKS